MYQIAFLDHVALLCRDLEHSARWYEKTLGLKRYTFAEWGPFPIFMLAGKTGLALFPAEETDMAKSKCVDHFAFQVRPEEFEKAQHHLRSLDVAFEWKDHHFFHSIYFADPDGHRVELTTLTVPADSFYAP